jgi:hypothetical protein
MIRILGVQRAEPGREEFVLLQNQGAMRVLLRGHVLLADDSIGNKDLLAYAFDDEVHVMPGNYVLLKTGPCARRWCMGPEGHRVYYTSMGRPQPQWSLCEGPVHLLAPQHTYCGRALEPLHA